MNENSDAASTIFKAAGKEFGSENLRFDQFPAKDGGHDFPVILSDGRIVSSRAESTVLLKLPPIAAEFIFIIPDKREKAISWLEKNRASIIKKRKKKNG
ncbi:MAG TPA: hypothetical protein VGR72_05625 [Candidatus Acidoferrales bacterium]|nr:hypothetical protein [Candidatus Acidoferrales bacterium]